MAWLVESLLNIHESLASLSCATESGYGELYM